MFSQKHHLFSFLFLLSAVIANASLLGTPGEYNIFSFGPVSLNRTEADGKIAAQGNISISSYGVAKNADPAQYTIISAGDVNVSNSSVFNGGIYCGNNSSFTGSSVSGSVATKKRLTAAKRRHFLR